VTYDRAGELDKQLELDIAELMERAEAADVEHKLFRTSPKVRTLGSPAYQLFKALSSLIGLFLFGRVTSNDAC